MIERLPHNHKNIKNPKPIVADRGSVGNKFMLAALTNIKTIVDTAHTTSCKNFSSKVRTTVR